MALARLPGVVPRAALQRGLLALLLLLALISTGVGVNNARKQSQDFQWSGERVLLQHADPYAAYRAGDVQHQFLQTQIPNYLPVFYVLIVPLGWFSLLKARLVWAAANVLFALVSGCLAGRAYGLKGRGTFGLVCLMMMATPTRNSIGNGQQGLLVLCLWCVGMFTRNQRATGVLAFGVAYFKYSFAPPMALYLFFRRGLRATLLSMIPAAAGTGAVWLWITGGRHPFELLRLAVEPFLVAQSGFKQDLGDPNLMNVLESLLARWHGPAVFALSFLAGAAACTMVSYKAFRKQDPTLLDWQMALMATMSYALFAHHAYDAVVLLLPLAYALARWRDRRAQAVLLLIGYLFYLERIQQALHLHPAWFRIPECIMLLAILRFTYQLRTAQLASAVSVAEGTADPVPVQQERSTLAAA